MALLVTVAVVGVGVVAVAVAVTEYMEITQDIVIKLCRAMQYFN